MAPLTIRLQSAPFDQGQVLAAFTAGLRQAGAVVTFTGLVRDAGGGLQSAPETSGLEIEHYPGMAERALTDIGQAALVRWPLEAVLILHRHGRLALHEPIMMVATAAPHRAAAFEAADFLMDYLKSRAPFWKKETGARGETWVVAKDHDEAALRRWLP